MTGRGEPQVRPYRDGTKSSRETAAAPALAAIDIGTNSTRLLVTDPDGYPLVRQTSVTGLGRGIADTGDLDPTGRERTLRVLAGYAEEMRAHAVGVGRAVMTAVGRNATDVRPFLEEAAAALGIRPEVISGEEEAELSYLGAVADLGEDDWTVVDIGGGSTEIVTASSRRSHEIGSVKLNDRHLTRRPATLEQLESARATTRDHLSRSASTGLEVVGVAGTWTSLAGLSLGRSNPDDVHHFRLSRSDVTGWIERLAQLSIEETAALPGFDPARAPVILGGSIVAEQVMFHLDAESCLVSERDILDGIVIRLRR